MYISTRGNIEPQTSAQAISLGMVPQGGLFVPEVIPRFNFQECLEYSYPRIAAEIIGLFLDDLPGEVVKRAVSVYTDGRFKSANPAPLVNMGSGCGMLELWHGPTAAFKDMALQVLPYFLTASLEKLRLKSEVLILTATSGDTGKAALEGFKDVPGTKIVVFYPDGGVSAVQERQMITTGGKNTFVCAVRGNFDECQTAVKRVFASEELRKSFAADHIVLSSANSINWGRLLPQIVYYFWAYLQAVSQGKTNAGDNINVVVPTGNFGNILAVYYAKLMGLPVSKIICASNRNKVLYDFFNSGIYDINRPFYLTSSPSMDILISSNFERFLFEISGRDGERVTGWFTGLARDGRFQVDQDTLSLCRLNMQAGWADENQVMNTIKKVFGENGYLLDPHTAVGVKVYEDYRQNTGDDTFTVIASTASPFKFAGSVLLALDQNKYAGVDPWQALKILSKTTKWEIPESLSSLQDKPVQPVSKIGPEEVTAYLSAKFLAE